MPLHGVRVIDLSRLLPGPLATLILSDLGAEVIRVENPAGDDYTRHLEPLYPDGMGAVFHTLNRGKKSVALDLKTVSGLDCFLQMLESADVLVESFRPGVLKKLNLAPKTLQKRFPRLIICSISGYGQSGPSAKKAGHDLNYLAKAGVLGAAENPAPLPVPIADIAGGSWPAAMQIMAALYGREHSKKGCYIDISMTAWAASLMILHVAKTNPLSGEHPCYGVYQTKDGHLTVAALEPHFWQTLIQTLGLPHLKDKAFASKAEACQIKAELQDIFWQKNTAAWQRIFSKLNACVEAIVKNNHMQPTRLPLSKALSHPSAKPAPQLGEDNADFLL